MTIHSDTQTMPTSEETATDGALVDLALSGSLVRLLRDNGHIPSQPVTDDDPDRDLHRAAAAWHGGAIRRAAGPGSRYFGLVSAADAAEIINYIESVVGALMSGATDADSRIEARGYARALSTAVAYLSRQAGVAVTVRRGPFGLAEYVVEVQP
jgi:hypothetical protein